MDTFLEAKRMKLTPAACGEEEEDAVVVVHLSQVPKWPQTWEEETRNKKAPSEEDSLLDLAWSNLSRLEKKLTVEPSLNDKISLWEGGDIMTRLEVDAVVNPVNMSCLSLLGSRSADIHRVAGPQLLRECLQTLNKGWGAAGTASMTGGYNLPAKHVIHVAYRIGLSPEELGTCYRNSFQLMLDHGLRSIAIPCFGTQSGRGMPGLLPNSESATMAIRETRSFLEKHRDEVDRIVFVLEDALDARIYKVLLQDWFPVLEDQDNDVELEASGK